MSQKKTIYDIITKDLGGLVRKKYRTHHLSVKMARQRMAKGPRFLKMINHGKWKWIVLVDEGWVYMTNCNGQRKIYYEFRGNRRPESWRKYVVQKNPIGVMVAMGITAGGPTGIYFVPPEAKVNSQFYVDKVLRPILQKDIPRLYGKLAKKVTLHHDSAPAHTSFFTYNSIVKMGFNFIAKEDWPANSPDISPMDFSLNGILKERLFRRRIRNLDGLKRAIRDEWKKIDPDLCLKVLRSWPDRVSQMTECQGFQFEHLR